MPKTPNEAWRNAMTDPPPIGERVIASNGKFTGEAYLKESRGGIVWCRCLDFHMWAGPVPKFWLPMPTPPDQEQGES